MAANLFGRLKFRQNKNPPKFSLENLGGQIPADVSAG